MAFEQFSKDMSIIAKLDDEPNDVGGLTAVDLKARFDEGGEALKEYINNVLIPALEEAGADHIVQYKENDGEIRFIRLNADKVLETSTDGFSWEATGSSGHLIVDKNGIAMPQRTRLMFTNSTIRDDGNMTIVEGVKGDKGDKGDTGERGERGIQGERGYTGPCIVPSISADGVMSFSIQDSAIAPQAVSVRGPQGPQGVQGLQGIQGVAGVAGVQGVQGIQGPKGDKGDDGSSFTVKGMYPTLPALKDAHPVGEGGDAYIVGTENTNVVYIWDVDAVTWVNVGPIQGPQGPQGPQGVQGIQGIQGVAGVSGKDGKSAYAAATEAGYSGTESAFNAALAETPVHIANKNNPHEVSAAQVGADASGSAAKALSDAKSYTDQKIAAIPTPDVSGQINTHNTNTSAHADIRGAIASKAPMYQYSTTDLTAGSSALTTGTLYFVYE